MNRRGPATLPARLKALSLKIFSVEAMRAFILGIGSSCCRRAGRTISAPSAARRELFGRDPQAGGSQTRVAERVPTHKPRFVRLFPTSVCVISSTRRG
jgi:hypothetical protein